MQSRTGITERVTTHSIVPKFCSTPSPDTFLTSETLNSDGWIVVTYLLFTPGYKSLLSVGMRPCPPPPPLRSSM